jgi:two-component system sensor histidine kinase YesM
LDKTLCQHESEKSGAISISGARLDGQILFSVADDGPGVSREAMRALLETPLSDADRQGAGGYGIRNVNERIRMKYGPEYGLSYENRSGGGAIAMLRVPAVAGGEPGGGRDGLGGPAS